MAPFEIGNPFRLVDCLEILAASWQGVPEEVQPDSPLLALLGARLDLLRAQLDQCSREVSRRIQGESAPEAASGQQDSGPCSNSHEGLIEEFRRTSAEYESERKRIAHACAPGLCHQPSRECIPTSIRVMEAVAPARISIASSFLAASSTQPRTSKSDHAIITEAVRCLSNGRRLDMDIRSLAHILGVIPRDDDESLSAEVISDDLLECLESGDAVADAILLHVKSNNDMTQLGVDVILGAGADWGYEYCAVGPRVLVEDTMAIKNILTRTIPESLHNDMTPQQQHIERDILQLASWLRGDEPESAELTSEEMAALVSKHPGSETLASSLRLLPGIEFRLSGLGVSYETDRQEVAKAYELGLYKSAAVLSGALLESLLREYIWRNNDQLQALINRDPMSVLGRHRDSRLRPDNLHTWSLDPLIKAASSIVSDKRLANRWVELQQARNSVHGRPVDRATAAFALATIVVTAELLLSGSAE